MYNLYRQHLERNGIVHSRSGDLSEAVGKLHRAICCLDLQQLKVVQSFLDKNVRDIINEFASIEELRGGF